MCILWHIIWNRIHISDSGSRYGFNILFVWKLYTRSIVRYFDDSKRWKKCWRFKFPWIMQFEYISIARRTVVHSKFGAMDKIKCYTVHTNRFDGHTTNRFIIILIGSIIIYNTHHIAIPFKQKRWSKLTCQLFGVNYFKCLFRNGSNFINS